MKYKPTIPGVIASIAVVIAIVAAFIIPSTETTTPPAPTPPPPEVFVCELDCLVDQRADLIYERDQQEYKNQARLKALIEIQDELHAITLNYGE